MKVLNVIEQNNENIIVDKLKRGDIIVAKKVDTKFLFYKDHIQGGGYCWTNIFNGHNSDTYSTIAKAITDIQEMGYKVITIQN